LLRPRGAKVSNVVTLNQKPASSRSTVLIFDEARQLVARSIVGTWGGFEGKPSGALEKEWRELARVTQEHRKPNARAPSAP
jgi:hypothetical protein